MKKRLKNIFNIENFIPNVLLPLLLLTVYFGSFTLVYDHYVLLGINSFFTGLSFIYSLSITIIVLIIYLPLWLIKKFRKTHNISFDQSFRETIDHDYLILLLFPITPVIQYLVNNREIVSWLDGLFVVIFFFLFCGLYIYLFPYIFRKICPPRILTAIGLAFASTITYMPLFTHEFNWLVEEKIFIPYIFFGGIFLFTFFMYDSKLKKLFFAFLLVNFFINTYIQFIPKKSNKDLDNHISSFVDNTLYSLLDERKPSTTPNVFILIYESYVPNETMLGYGIDNSSQVLYLQDQGFDIYPNVYSVGSPTVESLSRVFNVSQEFYGDKRRAVSGDGVVQNIFKDLGYQTYGISASDWIFLGTGSSYDVSFPEHERLTPYEILSLAILHGELSFDLLFEGNGHDEYLQQKHHLIRTISDNPILFYSHSDLPGHATDDCSPNEIDSYKENLLRANVEMRQDIIIIKEKDPGAIIIIAGDHGPYLTKNCFGTGRNYDVSEISRLDIQDRFATFLAIRWPTEEYENSDEIVVLQDLFPVIFSYIFNDIGILESKIDPNIVDTSMISGATVEQNIIYDGINDGEPLFLTEY